MRIVFVDNLLVYQDKFINNVPLDPHLGLMSLVAVARAAGHEATIYDPKQLLARGDLRYDESLYRAMARDIESTQPDVVGLTSLGCNFICAVKVASYLKRHNPDLPILLGGPHATILHRQLIDNFPQFDVIVRHEAESTLAPLLDALPDRRFDGILGLTYRKGEDVVASVDPPLIDDLDTLPFPAFDLYPMHELRLEKVHVEAGRGCPFECAFCSTAPFFKRRYRLKSPQRICAELDWLHERYGFTRFGLTHDLFTVNRKKVMAFCEEVANRGYSWSCSARMDCVDDELLGKMRAAGCESIYYGVETGSKRMQRLVMKKLDVDIVEPTLKTTIAYGMKPTVSTITGFPEEEIADQVDTLDLLSMALYSARDGIEPNLQMHLLTPEPGTHLADQFRGKLAYDGHVSDFNFKTLEADDGAIMRSNDEAFMNHFYFPTVIERERNVFMTSTFRLLTVLGSSSDRYLLLFFERSFTAVLTAMFEWWRAACPERAIDEALVLAFFEQRFGPDHHVVSLVRYLYAGLDLLLPRQEQSFLELAPYSDRAQAQIPYVPNPASTLLRKIHDCTKLLDALPDAIRTGATLSDGAVGERGDYLLVASKCGSGRINNYSLSPQAVLFLKLVESGCSPTQAALRFRELTGATLPSAIEERLRAIGAIVPNPARQGGRLGARLSEDALAVPPELVLSAPTAELYGTP